MADMLEKVARAIYEERRRNGNPEEGVHTSGEQWRIYLPAARAAIEVMREPTREMTEAGIVSIYGDTPIDSELIQEMQWAFASMIDIALKEKGNG